MPREARPDDAVSLRMEVSAEVRDRLMIVAARRGQSMAACLRQVVTEWVDGTLPPPKRRKRKEQAQ